MFQWPGSYCILIHFLYNLSYPRFSFCSRARYMTVISFARVVLYVSPVSRMALVIIQWLYCGDFVRYMELSCVSTLPPSESDYLQFTNFCGDNLYPPNPSSDSTPALLVQRPHSASLPEFVPPIQSRCLLRSFPRVLKSNICATKQHAIRSQCASACRDFVIK